MEIPDLLHPQAILVRDPAQAKRPLLEALARQLASRTELSFAAVLSALLDREKLARPASAKESACLTRCRVDWGSRLLCLQSSNIRSLTTRPTSSA